MSQVGNVGITWWRLLVDTAQEAPYFKTCSAFLQHLSPRWLELPFSHLCNMHIISCKPQSTWPPKLSWLVCTSSALLPLYSLSSLHETVLKLLLFLSKPQLLSCSLNHCFYIFLHDLLCHLHSSKPLHCSYACSSPALACSSFSKHSHESKLCK